MKSIAEFSTNAEHPMRMHLIHLDKNKHKKEMLILSSERFNCIVLLFHFLPVSNAKGTIVSFNLGKENHF